MLGDDSDDLFNVILKEVESDDIASTKSIPNSDSIGMHWILKFHVDWYRSTIRRIWLYTNLFIAEDDLFKKIRVKIQPPLLLLIASYVHDELMTNNLTGVASTRWLLSAIKFRKFLLEVLYTIVFLMYIRT